MQLIRNADYYRDAIENCERNIEFVKHSNFSDKEKRDLQASYRAQIASYKRKLQSFFQPADQ